MSSALHGFTICATGKFPVTRSALSKTLEAHGATVASSVTKKVTHLLAEGDNSSAKYKKAVANGVTIVDLAWLEAAIGPLAGGGSGSGGAQPSRPGVVTRRSTRKRKAAAGAAAADDDDDDEDAAVGKPLAGKVVCVSGTISLGKRAEVAKMLEDLGATVSGSVTKATTDLLSDGNTGSSKYTKAVAKSIPIHDEAWLAALVNGSGSGSGGSATSSVASTAGATAAASGGSNKKQKTLSGAAATLPVDDACQLQGAQVVENYSCMLNQTDIRRNANKFYRIQVLSTPGPVYHLYTHWGRVGARGQDKTQRCSSLADAITGFKKKFSAKTLNSWDNRASFVQRPGKYQLIGLSHGESDDDESDDDESDEGTGGGEETGGAGASGGAAGNDGGSDDYLFSGRLKSGELLYIIENDICEVEADCVVHPTASHISTGGQVGRVLALAGGAGFRKAISDFSGSIPVNGAVITSAGDLPASHVVHVNSPSFNGRAAKASYAALAKTIHAALETASDAGLVSIAFPSIGSGVNGFPKDGAARVILSAIGEWFSAVEADGEETSLDEVIFVLYDPASMACYRNQFQEISSGLMGHLE
ncbi:histone H2A [Thecamonas trahens ATCC 50062]|uniref:NAD(+) ADP-ribosyltransferase n=1 Tax=Thecamonas trahens ATCC 50062 TaxID=461836 RepID=A0A0L0DFD8_THETB|nr:histone H2A [Thecamonas trahens ATCC 50062]KNC50856.1 histone H2A [Thecamonas trahens ATCC 50062]|eukprot:XP_013756808.1 histone H2A [Thecamonas trahens ATCC 50062]